MNILLETFQDRCWLNTAAFAVLAAWRPVRSVYSYLARLWRWGLLERRRNARGLMDDYVVTTRKALP